MQRVLGRVALITGASSGIGRAIAEGMAEEGAAVVIVDRDREDLRIIQTAHHSLKRTSLAVSADISDQDSVTRLITECISEFGRIDILVNAASVFLPAPIEDLSEEIWDRVLRFNLVGKFLCSKAVVPGMLKQGYGRIISVTSPAAFRGCKHNAHYAAAMAAIIGFSKSLALELAPHQVTVNTICHDPYDRHDDSYSSNSRLAAESSGTLVESHNYSKAFVGPAIFLVSDAASYITGQTVFVASDTAMIEDGKSEQN